MISKEAMEWMWLLLICIIILLITACVMLEYRSQRDSELASKACEHLQNVMYALQQAEIKTGVCCCGDNMEGHDPGYNCGHSPSGHVRLLWFTCFGRCTKIPGGR